MRVHNLDLSTGDAYDLSQTDLIKDGDVMVLSGGEVAIMMQAWPVYLGGGDGPGEFHEIADGYLWENLQDGHYVKTVMEAESLYQQKGE
jgi:hypothetical protein